jgi:hypothetical protein
MDKSIARQAIQTGIILFMKAKTIGLLFLTRLLGRAITKQSWLIDDVARNLLRTRLLKNLPDAKRSMGVGDVF